MKPKKDTAPPQRTTLDPAKVFERRWATTLLEQTLCPARSRIAYPREKSTFRAAPGISSGDPSAISYAEAGKRLGMRAGAVKVAVFRLRQRFQGLLRAEIANTVANQGKWKRNFGISSPSSAVEGQQVWHRKHNCAMENQPAVSNLRRECCGGCARGLWPGVLEEQA